MNKDKIKQLRDALIVIKEECASHDPECPSSCPFYNGDLGGVRHLHRITKQLGA